MSTYIVDGPCPDPSCAALVQYGVDHVDETRVLAGTCKACGAFQAYDGAKNITVLPEE
jgi:hypothetical protein